MANAELYDHADLLYSSPRFRQVVQVAAIEVGLVWDETVVLDVLNTPSMKSFFATFKEWSVTLLETGRDRDPNVTATIDAAIREAVSHVKDARASEVES